MNFDELKAKAEPLAMHEIGPVYGVSVLARVVCPGVDFKGDWRKAVSRPSEITSVMLALHSLVGSTTDAFALPCVESGEWTVEEAIIAKAWGLE